MESQASYEMRMVTAVVFSNLREIRDRLIDNAEDTKYLYQIGDCHDNSVLENNINNVDKRLQNIISERLHSNVSNGAMEMKQ